MGLGRRLLGCDLVVIGRLLAFLFRGLEGRASIVSKGTIFFFWITG